MKTAIDIAKFAAKPETLRETLLLGSRLSEEAVALFPSAASTVRAMPARFPSFLANDALQVTGWELQAIPKLGQVSQLATPSKTLIDSSRIQPLTKEGLPGSDKIQSILKETGNFELVGRIERGTRGAWLVSSKDGTQHIFKQVSDADVTTQLRHSSRAAQFVDSFRVRTPRYESIGYSSKHGSWYVQEVLPGVPDQTPSTRLITQMMKVNERQAGNGIPGQRNWSDEIMGALYKDSKGWQEAIAKSGPDGKALVQEVRAITEPNRLMIPRSTDIVHGDYQHYNALVSNTRKERLTAVIDWDSAGRGDRGIDLSRLLYDAYVSQAEIGFKANPHTLRMLGQRIDSISGRAARENYMSFWALQVADYGVKVGPTHAKMFTDVGRQVVTDLKSGGLLYRLAG